MNNENNASPGLLRRILDFYSISAPADTLSDDRARFKRVRWVTFITATVGYALYYVCRLSMNIVRKPIVDDGVFTESQLGIIGSCLFFVIAVGKLANGFLADRSNVRRFMATGLILTAIVNLLLGMTEMFWAFALLWGLNGWFQSMGAPAGVVSLNRWFTSKDRGTFYGLWSASHNIGEAVTFITIAMLVSYAGWKYGFIGAGIIGICGTALVSLLMRDTPESSGFVNPDPAVATKTAKATSPADFNKAQKAVLRNPAIWCLAFASAFMYISRYAVNSWGVFYLEAQKGYTTLDASLIISISSVCGIVGTVASGLISDRLFNSSRNLPTLVAGLMNVVALCLFLLVPGVHFWLDALAMVLFGLGIGVLISFLGGLMAVDIAPRAAVGAALGIVGIVSYIGAGLQDVINGVLIEGKKTVDATGADIYDFTYVNWFWIGAAAVSVLLTLPVWNAAKNREN
jgi:OPA family sugar phosphate sensor protein UhpC-like MFS transporter